MHPKQFARFGGGILVIVGLLALIPSFSTFSSALPTLTLDNSYGIFANAVPMNIVNKLVLIGLGLLGIFSTMSSTRSLPLSIRWSQWVAGIAALTFVLGLMPSTNTLGGYMPLFGGDVVFHAVFGLVAAYYGFVLKAKADHKIAPLIENDKQFSRKVS
jgi:hypothetical protein